MPLPFNVLRQVWGEHSGWSDSPSTGHHSTYRLRRLRRRSVAAQSKPRPTAGCRGATNGGTPGQTFVAEMGAFPLTVYPLENLRSSPIPGRAHLFLERKTAKANANRRSG